MTRRKLRLPHLTDLDTRYVTERRDKSGLRRYWQRKDHKLVRLPDDLTWAEVATALNRNADSSAADAQIVEGTVAWIVNEYRASDRYLRLAPTSKATYERVLLEVERLWGRLPLTAITRRVVVKYISRFDGKNATKNLVAAVLYNLLDLAMYHGLVQQNYAAKLRITRGAPRSKVCSYDEVLRYTRAARTTTSNWAPRLYFWLMLYTGQRPGDVVKMRWNQHDGEHIRVRQQKTGKLIEVPCHRNLRRILAVAKRHANGLFIVAQVDGRPYVRHTMSDKFRAIRERAGIEELQPRDLRRTAAVTLAEAGCTDFEVSAITGHDIETTRRILETYVPRNQRMARSAIAKWERNVHKESNALD